MLQRPHTLQPGPVLKPQDLRHRIFDALPLQALDKSRINIPLNQLSGRVRHVAALGNFDRSTKPDDQVRDPRVHSVGPVVAQDLVVRGIGKGSRVTVAEGRFVVGSGGGVTGVGAGAATVGQALVGDEVWLPPEALFADIVCYAPILGFDGGCPGYVAPEVRGSANERPEVVPGCLGATS